MIDHAIGVIASRLGQQLRAQFSVDDDLVAVAPLTDWEGKPTAATRNRLALFITNISDDKVSRSHGTAGLSSTGVGSAAEPIHLDIYFMVAAHFDAETYAEGLKILSAAVRFFQSTPVFTPLNTPDMAPGLTKLSVEISNLRSDEIGQMWGNLGGRYVPSVLYRLRSVRIDGNAIDRVLPAVTETEQGATPAGVRARAS